jgi:hypothetical protein
MKKTITTTLLGLLLNSVFSNRAEAIVYNVNASFDDGTTTGTIIGTMSTVPGNNPSGLGDYAGGDFTFGNYQLNLIIGGKTFTAINSNSTLSIQSLEVGDLTANNTGLFLDFRNPNPIDAQDVFDIMSTSSEGGLGILSFDSGSGIVYDSTIVVGKASNISVVTDSREINFQLGTAVPSASVPFEFSPSLGLILMGAFWGLFSRLRTQP